MGRLRKLKQAVGRWFAVPWYPVLFGAYPVLALLAFNIGQVKIEAGWRALLVCVSFAALLMLFLRLVMHGWNRAAFLSTLWMALFFSYGHAQIMITKKFPGVAFERWLVIGWAALAILAAVWAVKGSAASPLALNGIALGLVVTSVWQIGSGLGRGGFQRVGAENAPVDETLIRPENPPDVYYFILDSYGREDLLKYAYGYDNSSFIEGLERRGFYVAQCSQSNYIRTELSLGSSLNMSYLQDLDSAFTPDSIKRRILWDSLKHNAARYNFENLGYKTVAFATGYAWSDWDDADVFYTPPPFSAGMTEFETLFLETTLARHAQDFGWVDADAITGQNFRDRTLLVFDRVDDIARMPEPTFAHIHVISPHPPFVFGPDGEPTYPGDFWNKNHEYPAGLYAEGYQNQLTFLNRKLLEAVDTILAESETPPIIVLQGDHGPWHQPRDRRMWILNAYYLPGHQDELFPKLSPVNTFRIIFNSYFGGNYDMLPNVSYFSPVPKLYDFSEVVNTCDLDDSEEPGQ